MQQFMGDVVIIYFWMSVLLYLLLGGADFGAGIVELFTSERGVVRTRRTVYQAIGPIWEANHMWLIIAVVILFVGFPAIYSILSVHLHIPLVIMLLGITARGTAFVFRHYDAVEDQMQEVYSKVFVWSSFITPLFLGIIAGALLSGRIDPAATTFVQAYISSWFNLFSIAVGVFTVSLCGYLASVYLIGEAKSDVDRNRFIRKARYFNIAAFVCGLLVFIAAYFDDVPLVAWVFGDVVGFAAVVAATASLILMWSIPKSKTFLLRALVVVQVTMILLAISFAHYPEIVLLRDSENLSLLRHQAPAATMNALGWALILGSILILPALGYLFFSFSRDQRAAGTH